MLQPMTWHPLLPCDETYFDTAPYVYRYPVELDVSPERVWEALTSDRSMADWGLGIHSLRWTSPRPFGVGTTREIVLPGKVMAVREQFFRWEEGPASRSTEPRSTARCVARFAEDYLVEPTGGWLPVHLDDRVRAERRHRRAASRCRARSTARRSGLCLIARRRTSASIRSHSARIGLPARRPGAVAWPDPDAAGGTDHDNVPQRIRRGLGRDARRRSTCSPRRRI